MKEVDQTIEVHALLSLPETSSLLLWFHPWRVSGRRLAFTNRRPPGSESHALEPESDGCSYICSLGSRYCHCEPKSPDFPRPRIARRAPRARGLSRRVHKVLPLGADETHGLPLLRVVDGRPVRVLDVLDELPVLVAVRPRRRGSRRRPGRLWRGAAPPRRRRSRSLRRWQP